MSDFFILSCSRSGSTLLASVLNSHPAIVVPAEEWWLSTASQFGACLNNRLATKMFLTQIRKNIEAGNDKRVLRAVDAAYAEVKNYTGSYSGLLRAFSAGVCRELSKSAFGLKTPANTTFFAEINHTFPEFRNIVLLRDPRDILCSYIYAWYGGVFTDATIFEAAKTIKVYLHNIINYLRGEDLVVKYEFLTRNPSVELARIFAHLGVPDVSGLPSKFVPTISPAGIHANLSKSIGVNARSYSMLPENLVERMEYVFRRELDALDYPRRFAQPDAQSALLRELDSAVNAIVKREAPGKLSDNWTVSPSSWIRHAIRYSHYRITHLAW